MAGRGRCCCDCVRIGYDSSEFNNLADAEGDHTELEGTATWNTSGRVISDFGSVPVTILHNDGFGNRPNIEVTPYKTADGSGYTLRVLFYGTDEDNYSCVEFDCGSDYGTVKVLARVSGSDQTPLKEWSVENFNSHAAWPTLWVAVIDGKVWWRMNASGYGNQTGFVSAASLSVGDGKCGFALTQSDTADFGILEVFYGRYFEPKTSGDHCFKRKCEIWYYDGDLGANIPGMAWVTTWGDGANWTHELARLNPASVGGIMDDHDFNSAGVYSWEIEPPLAGATINSIRMLFNGVDKDNCFVIVATEGSQQMDFTLYRRASGSDGSSLWTTTVNYDESDETMIIMRIDASINDAGDIQICWEVVTTDASDSTETTYQSSGTDTGNTIFALGYHIGFEIDDASDTVRLLGMWKGQHPDDAIVDTIEPDCELCVRAG